MQAYNVSRETFDKLDAYYRALTEWQQKFNLVSNSSLSDAWQRHFADSAQLFVQIPASAQSLLDMGSGAGFPGMVLAIMSAAQKPDLKVTLAESIGKKVQFLQYVKALTIVDAEIFHGRVESIAARKFDVITARAMTALTNLLAYAHPLLKKNGCCLFLKGEHFAEELTEAEQKWRFDYETIPSQTSAQSVILKIYHPEKK